MEKLSYSDQIRAYARERFIEPARKRGETTVRIVAGDIVRALQMAGRVPSVCQSMKSNIFLEENGLTIVRQEGPPSGQGTRVAITYQLAKGTAGASPGREAFLALRGIGKAVFESLGGGEAYLRRERSEFYGKDQAKSGGNRRAS